MGVKGGNEEGKGDITVVLKVDLHCDGCARKVKRAVGLFEGVESAATDENYTKLSVVGKVDPEKLRERVEQKIHKKVVLISPLEAPKVDKKSEEKPREEKRAEEKPHEETKAEEKPEPPKARTVVLKIRLHCEGCIKKIRKTICKIKGVEEVTIDVQRDQVIIKGTMDMVSLPSYLKGKFGKNIEVVPKKEEGGGQKKEKGESGGDKKDSEGGGDKVEKSVDGSVAKKKDKSGEKMDGSKSKDVSRPETKAEVSKMEYYSGGAATQYYSSGATNYASNGNAPMQHYYNHGSSSNDPKQYYYTGGSSNATMQYYDDRGDASRAYVPYAQPYYPQPYHMELAQAHGDGSRAYGPPYAQPYYPQPYHAEIAQAPQLFSDENPNACSIM